jgi:transcriptional regulator with XRE-family HTH domain
LRSHRLTDSVYHAPRFVNARDIKETFMAIPTPGFGARLTAIRNARGVTQKELADALGVHAVWVSKLERGSRSASNLPVGDVFRLARLLGVSPMALIVGWEEETFVDFDLPGVEPWTARRVWDSTQVDETLDRADQMFWLRFSPHDVEQTLDDIDTVITDLAEGLWEAALVRAYARPRLVFRGPDDEEGEVVYTLDPDVERELRNKLADVIRADARTGAEQIAKRAQKPKEGK